MHIEYDDFGSYEETADLVPVSATSQEKVLRKWMRPE